MTLPLEDLLSLLTTIEPLSAAQSALSLTCPSSNVLLLLFFALQDNFRDCVGLDKTIYSVNHFVE